MTAHGCVRCSENSASNAWIANFGNGQLNNNNKYNGYNVRAVAALDDEYTAGWFEAFDACCANKKMSTQCVMYRLSWHDDLMRLALEVHERSYKPSTSLCFVVTRPKLREVFAANFRDRIVQHWLCLRLEPLFERRFVAQGDVSFNCRKGFGTLSCIKSVAADADFVSCGYKDEAWYVKCDIKGFFMSIDCEVLLDHLLPFIEENWGFWDGTPYAGDLDLCLWLAEVIVRHRPAEDCHRIGNISLWKRLPAGKSLFHTPPMRGEPIGNITSQLFANFYMSLFDEWAVKVSGRFLARYRRFVDDFVFVCRSKDDAIGLKTMSEAKLEMLLHVRLHPDKVYIQEVKKGVRIVGGVIKPGRTYLMNKTVGGFMNAVRDLEVACTECEKNGIAHAVCRVNSYLGFLVHHSSYALRRKAFSGLKSFWKVCYIKGRFKSVAIRKKFKLCG